ncbi:MAG TPA: peptide chain release factor N(5)-glutamine methyltransferase [Mycobacteriales bacterium]|nr:peptide chain release factor N(5)-glutamine methyltransferase [Mycobacteriales bacterium]
MSDAAEPARAAALLRAATATLTAAGVPTPRTDAEQLLAAACAVRRGAVAGLGDIDAAAADRFRDLVRRRAERVPLQHLTGRAGFRHLELAVGAGVFVPRPETEVVAGAAIDAARAVAGGSPVVVDLCSGSGAIALAVAQELPVARVHAVELDADALRWLTRNAAARAAAGDPAITVHAGDARTALPELDGTVDVVVSNPPYVPLEELDLVEPEVRDHDPRPALIAGHDGLDLIRHLALTAWRLLRPGGWFVVEHSDRQGESVPGLLRTAGFTDVSDHRDLTDRPRYTRGRRS